MDNHRDELDQRIRTEVEGLAELEMPDQLKIQVLQKKIEERKVNLLEIDAELRLAQVLRQTSQIDRLAEHARNLQKQREILEAILVGLMSTIQNSAE